RGVGAEHLDGVHDAVLAARDGDDPCAGRPGQLDGDPADGAGGRADQDGLPGLDVADVVDTDVRGDAGRAQHADPVQRCAEGPVRDLVRRDGGGDVGLLAGVGGDLRAGRDGWVVRADDDTD